MKQIFCNKCGKQFDFWDEQEDYSIHTRIGYGSKYDEEELRLDLCIKCMENLIDGCVINPLTDYTEVQA